MRNYGCRIKNNISYKGVDVIFLENDLLRVGIITGKGTDFFEFLYKPKDMDFIWLSPFEFSPPEKYFMTKNQSSGRFMDFYEGGWQEIFPNGGGTCNVSGAEFGQHDEVSLLPWNYEIIEDAIDKIEVKFFVNTRLTPFLLEKNIILERNSPSIVINEKVFNKSSVDLNAIWGHHLSYGFPFLEEGCKISLNASGFTTYDLPGVSDENIELNKKHKWPILTTNDGKETDLSIIPSEKLETSKFLYIDEIAKGEYEIINEKKKLGIKIEWDKKIMPCLWYWQEFNKSTGYPWYKMSRVFGLEPFSTNIMGLNNTINKNKGLKIRGSSEIEFSLKIKVNEFI
ncbi:MAG: DUF4432 family protein [Actinomycetota bacterium]|nr:DUF4432 family protein [Actinomycetota bacterium]